MLLQDFKTPSNPSLFFIFFLLFLKTRFKKKILNLLISNFLFYFMPTIFLLLALFIKRNTCRRIMHSHELSEILKLGSTRYSLQHKQ